MQSPVTPAAARARSSVSAVPRLMFKLSYISAESEEDLDEDGISLYSNDRVKARDGGFFEYFSAVNVSELGTANKSDEPDGALVNRARRGTLSEVLLNSFYTMEMEHKKEISKRERDMLYVEAMYTIKHKIGAETNTKEFAVTVDDLYAYCKTVFNVTDEQHARLLAITNNASPPILILNVKVEEARDLMAKDADGFSDPYCMLGVIPGSRLQELKNDKETGRDKEGKTLLRKFSSSLRDRMKKSSKDDIKPEIPAKYIQSTKVIDNTLNPVWQEKFRFEVEDMQSDKLHVDVWDHDDEDSVFDAAKSLNQIQNMKGLGRVFKQIAQSARAGSGDNVDDFLGAIDIPLNDIPSTGRSEWYDLCGRSSKSKVHGQIKIRLNLATREDHGMPIDDNFNDVKQHEDLLGLFIQYERGRFSGGVSEWDGSLPEEASAILHQHAIQGDITDTQQVYCHWLAYTAQFRVCRFHPSRFWSILNRLDSCWEIAELSGEEEANLSKSFRIFLDFVLQILENIKTMYPADNPNTPDLLSSLLEAIQFLVNSKVYAHCCSSFDGNFSIKIAQHLKNGARDVYTKAVAAICTTKEASVEQKLKEITKLSELILKEIETAAGFYQEIFETTLHFPYLDPVYKLLERKLSTEVRKLLDENLSSVLLAKPPKPMREELDRRSSRRGSLHDQQQHTPADHVEDAKKLLIASVLKLYHIMHSIEKYSMQLRGGGGDNLTISRYQEWFSRSIQEWLGISKCKLEARIEHAVADDQLNRADDNFDCSTSAVDVVNCYNQISEFWRKLEWRNVEESFAFSLKLYDDMCQSAILYTDLLHLKMKKSAYFDDEGQFDVQKPLCVCLNDLEYIRRSIEQISGQLQLSKVIERIEEHHHTHSDVLNPSHFRTVFSSIESSTTSTMLSKIVLITRKVADRMRPDIKKNVFRLSWLPEGKSIYAAIEPLIEYLNQNLQTLYKYLLRRNFKIILAEIWQECLEELSEMIKDAMEQSGGDNSTNGTHSFTQLQKAIDVLKDFFNADDKGLTQTELETKFYQDVYWGVKMQKYSTEEVITNFFKDMLELQPTYKTNVIGVIGVKAYYDPQKRILNIEVNYCKKIIALDSNGLSDPYIEWDLCPRHVFNTVPGNKTTIKKKTLNPIYDETFQVQVSPDILKTEGACVRFTLMDYNFVVRNDFGGEAYLSTRRIPGVGRQGEIISTTRPTELIFMKPQTIQENLNLLALTRRTKDSTAKQFVSTRMALAEEAESHIADLNHNHE